MHGRAGPSRALGRDARGAGLVEYVIIVGAIAMLALGGVRSFGKSLRTKANQQAGTIMMIETGQPGSPFGPLGNLLGGGGAAPGGFCFAAGTEIATPGGPRAIESLRPGDTVWSRDEETAEVAPRPVERTRVTVGRAVLDVVVVGDDRREETIRATPRHPFHVAGGAWREADHLAAGDRVDTADGRWLEVVSETLEPATATVYNLEVEGFHSYFVGAHEAWVHNGCSIAPSPEEQQHLRELGTDPKKGFQQAEQDAAQLLEERVGPLVRSPDSDYDWTSPDGKTTYDAVGPLPPQALARFNIDEFTASINGHLLTQGLDYVVVDTTGLTPDQKKAVATYIASRTPAEQARIIQQSR